MSAENVARVTSVKEMESVRNEKPTMNEKCVRIVHTENMPNSNEKKPSVIHKLKESCSRMWTMSNLERFFMPTKGVNCLIPFSRSNQPRLTNAEMMVRFYQKSSDGPLYRAPSFQVAHAVALHGHANGVTPSTSHANVKRS